MKKPKMPATDSIKAAFSKLYGYTTDEQGIRHSLLEKSEVGFPEAKFMLVACSAFINFALQKQSS